MNYDYEIKNNKLLREAYEEGRRQALAEQPSPGGGVGGGGNGGPMGGVVDPIIGGEGGPSDGPVCDWNLGNLYLVGGDAYRDPRTWGQGMQWSDYNPDRGYTQRITFAEQMGGGNAMTTAPDTAGTAMTPTNMRSQPMDSVMQQKQTAAPGKFTPTDMTSTPKTSPRSFGAADSVGGGSYATGINGKETFFSPQGQALSYFDEGRGTWVSIMYPLQYLNL
tara:strand:+ start:163 stop:822 length:660 start_codon:yes stop_codon:yes gene_type:complete